VSEVIRVLVVIAVIGYVIGRQLMGEPLRGKRVVLLPVILAVAGAVDLDKHGRHVEPADVVFLVISGLIAVTIGLLQGRMIRLESRNGALWGQMPVRGLWLWALLVGSRLTMTVIALAVGAKVAGSSAPIIMLLGINRLGQAAIVMRHALATGIPFAPEKDGRSFLSGFLSGQVGDAAARTSGRTSGPASRYPPQRGARSAEPDWPPAAGQDSWQDADPARYPHRVLPPADDADPAGHPQTGRGEYGPRGSGEAPDLATLARLAGEWLAARRQRGR
jgi:hypothetical protein